jgi:hypothetical protein
MPLLAKGIKKRVSTNVQPGGAYGVNLESQSLDANESGDAKSPHLSEYNAQMNWNLAAQLERTERGNISWFKSSSKTEKQ